MFENTERIPGRYGRSTVRDPNYQSLNLAAYSNSLPDPEPAWSNLAIMQDRVGTTNNKVLFPTDGNDQYGCCTISALAHLITLLAGMAGLTIIPTAKDVIALYFYLSGGRDNGLNLSDVLTWWKTNPFNGVQITAEVQIDPNNWNLIKQAIQFFGHVYIGFNTTTDVISKFNQGIPWDSGRLDGQAHCVDVTDYNVNGSGTCLTWGNKQDFTPAFWKQCVDEVRVVITPYNTVFTNETMANLTTDLASLGTGSTPQFR